MIKLFAKKQNTDTEILLDTIGDENISIQLSIDDIQTTEAKQTTFTKDFNLPATDVNNQFFEHYYKLDRYANNFNAYKRIDCRLEVDGITVLDGFLNLINVTKKGEEYYYKVVAYDKVANLFDILGESTFLDLTFEDILHDYTQDQVEDSWTTTGVTLDAGGTSTDVYYPFIGNDQFYNPFVINAGTDSNLKYEQNVPLSLRLKYVIDKIFDFAGITYVSNFLNDTNYFGKMYFDTTTQPYTYEYTQNIVKASVNDVGDFTATGYPVTLSNTYVYPNFAFEQQDDANEFDLTTDTFTASQEGALDLQYRCRIKNTASSIRLVTCTMEMANNSYMADGDYTIAVRVVYGNSSGQVTEFFPPNGFYVSAGTTVKIKLKSSNTGTSITNDIGGVGNQFIYDPHNRLAISLASLDSPSAKIKAKIGDIKLADIVRDCFKLFNLVAEPTQVQDQLKIEPYMDFVAGGRVLDWTDKVDISKAEIKPIDIPKSINLKMAEDSDDFYLERYKTVNGTEYGNQYIEFQTDSTKEIEIECSVFAPAYVQTQNMPLSLGEFIHIGTEDGDDVIGYKNQPRLFFKGTDIGVLTGQDQIWWGNQAVNSNTTYVTQQYSSGSHYESTPPTNSVNTITFGTVSTMYIDGNHPPALETLYEKFYRAYFEERSDEDSLLYIININLNPVDIFNFTFADRVQIKGDIYRVNKITYNTAKNKLSKIELYRL